jgi:hypothetical protein
MGLRARILDLPMNRREFLAGSVAPALSGAAAPDPRSFRHRIAFTLWINDVRNRVAPLENWPSAALDDETVDSIVRALDLQAVAGYNAVDFCGLLATAAWPVEISTIASPARRKQVDRIIRAAHERHIRVIAFPAGVLSWGFDAIIRHDPAVASDNKHVMNPLREESWEWQRKVFDFVLDNFDLDGVHLESADLGRCRTKECLERWPGDVAYHCYVTARTAEYLRRKRPGLLLEATVQNFKKWGQNFTPEEVEHVAQLSRTVDCVFDQGHQGTYVPEASRRDFLAKLHCDYGTSGGLWIYPPQRWSRTRWFLPVTQRAGRHIRQLYKDGGRGLMYYQGPVSNPGAEVNVAFGGRLMLKPENPPEDVLAEVLEVLYRPRDSQAHAALVELFRRAEDAYFGEWDHERVRKSNGGVPGEVHLHQLAGASPNAAAYLAEPYLTAESRLRYKQALVSLYRQSVELDGRFSDSGRLARIRESIESVLADINNIAFGKGEREVFDDSRIGQWL